MTVNGGKDGKGRRVRGKFVPLSLTQFAARLGISRKGLNAAFERGEIPVDCYAESDNGRVLTDPDKAEAAYKAAKALRDAKGPKVVSVNLGGPELPANFDVEDPETWPLDLEGLKMVREWWIARQAKRKDDLAAGELVRADDMRRELFSAARVVRDQLLKIPDGAAADVAAEMGVADVDSVRRILRTSIERGLSDLSTALQSVLAADEEEGNDDVEL